MTTSKIVASYEEGCRLSSGEAGTPHDSEQAEAVFAALVRVDPHHHQALNMLGLLRERRDDHQGAAALFRKALEIERRGVYLVNLGIALLESGEVKEALGVFQDAAALEPRNAAAYFNLGQAHWRLNEIDEAIACWQVTLGLDATYPAIYSSLGTAFFKADRFLEAERALREGLRTFPLHVDMTVLLGTVLETSGRWGEASLLWEELLTRGRDLDERVRIAVQSHLAELATGEHGGDGPA